MPPRGAEPAPLPSKWDDRDDVVPATAHSQGLGQWPGGGAPVRGTPHGIRARKDWRV